MLSRLLMWTSAMFALTAPLCAQLLGTPREFKAAALNERHSEADCALDSESFPLKAENLTVMKSDGGILFTAGMTIDADGAPNAYGPRNRGLDFTANAKGSHGWVALVTNKDGHPILQKSGPYRGYYVSTTSLQQTDINDLRSPKRYIDATKIPYIALPSDFTTRFDINLGDLAVVVNQSNGRSAMPFLPTLARKAELVKDQSHWLRRWEFPPTRDMIAPSMELPISSFPDPACP